MPISALPTPPSRSDSVTFAERSDAFLAALPTFRAEANTLQTEVNAKEASALLSASSASLAAIGASTAAANANFKGVWIALTGALSVPASALHNGQLWQLTANLANVTTAQPGVSANWMPIVDVDVASRAPIQPTLDLDFANQRYRVLDGALGLKEIALADLMTYTGSGRTYIDALGIVRAQSSNVPRLTFDAATGAGLGLSVWGARTNLLLQSGFSGAVGGSPGTSPTSWTLSTTGSPALAVTSSKFGANDAAQALTFSGASGDRHHLLQTITVTAGTQYQFSFEVEAVSGITGVVATVSNGTATATINQTVSSPTLTGRYTSIFTADTAGTVTLRLGFGATGPVGGGVSISISRPQLEAGSAASPYIPTTTAAVTAPTDVATITGANFSKWFNGVEGTLVCVYRNPQDTASTLGFVAIGGGTTANQIGIRQQSGTGRLSIATAGTQETSLNSAALLAGALAQTAIAYASNNGGVSFSGASVQTDLTLNLPVLERLDIGNTGSGGSSTAASTTIARILYFPRALPANLQALSA